MMFSRYFNANHNANHADMSASAPRANANTSCAQSASANNSMIFVLDAIIMASIIICAIINISMISILGLIVLLAILVLVRLIGNSIPLWQRKPAV